jgi:hypothetical protein
MKRYASLCLVLGVVGLEAVSSGQTVETAEPPAFCPVNAEVGLPYPMPDTPLVGLIDVDQDGYVDLLLGTELWLNDGKGRFVRSVVLPGRFLSFGDFDNDGDLDVYATSHNEEGGALEFKQWLLRCDERGRYTDILAESGLKRVKKPVKPDAPYPYTDYASMAHGFVDYDRDGNLDLFVAGYEVTYGKDSWRAIPARLYRGDGRGHFADVTDQAGFNVEARPAVAVAFADFDNDGFVDIFVTHSRGLPDRLWRNQGDGTFREIAAEVGAGGAGGDSTGVAVADFDGDGDLDIFVARRARGKEGASAWPSLLRNELAQTSKLQFTEVTAVVGLDWRPTAGFQQVGYCICPVFADFNNDGWPDLFITESAEGGMNCRRTPAKHGRFEGGYSRVFVGLGGTCFRRADTDSSGLRIEDSWGVAAGDFDLDGRVDLLVGSGTRRHGDRVDWFDPASQRVELLRGAAKATQSQAQVERRHYLNVVLSATDRAVTGATVRVVLDDASSRRAAVDTSCGAWSVKCNQVHFGLGPHVVRRIEVTLPDGQTLSWSGRWRDASLLLDVSREASHEPRTLAPWR